MFFGVARMCEGDIGRKKAKMMVWSSFIALLQAIEATTWVCVTTYGSSRVIYNHQKGTRVVTRPCTRPGIIYGRKF